jgi:hypothetical protein
MKKANMLLAGMIVSLILVINVIAQMPPKPDKKQPTAPTHIGDVVSLQGSILTVTGGKGGQTAFNIATASWKGYSSPSETKAGDHVIVTYLGTVDGVRKAIAVAKQGNASAGGGSATER